MNQQNTDIELAEYHRTNINLNGNDGENEEQNDNQNNDNNNDYDYGVIEEKDSGNTDNSSSPKKEVNLTDLHSVHINSLKNKNNNNHNTRKIVNILGGIDCILTNYINIMISIANEYGDEYGDKSLILLNSKQIEDIYHLIIEEQNINNIIGDNKNIDNGEEFELNEFAKYRYCFFTHNTFIYNLFKNKDIAYKIMRILYSKILIGIQCIINIGYPILLVAFTRFSIYNNNILNIFELVIYVLFTLYFLFILSSINNYAFSLIYKKTFEFWLKLFYTFLLCTFYAIYEIYFGDILNENGGDIITILSLIFQILSVLLMVILLCCIDSLQFPSILKFLSGLALSVFFITMSIYYTMKSFDIKCIDDNDNNNINKAIALTSFISNSSRIIAIYIMHHTYLSITNPEKSVLLRYIPYIHWIDKYNLNHNHSSSTDIDINDSDNEIENEILNQYILHQQKPVINDNRSHIEEEEKEEEVKQENDEAIDIQITSINKNESNSLQNDIDNNDIDDNDIDDNDNNDDDNNKQIDNNHLNITNNNDNIGKLQDTDSLSVDIENMRNISIDDSDDQHNNNNNNKNNMGKNHMNVVMDDHNNESDSHLTMQSSHSVRL